MRMSQIRKAAAFLHHSPCLTLQELRTVRVRDGLLDKVSDGVIGEVTLEFIPGSDQAA